MKILRVPWIGHDVTTIYSADFHPVEPYLATAGGDSNVLIWSTEPIFSEEKEDDENTPRLLSTLKGHTNVVTCCRWSPDGKWLASASDDETIRIWRKDENYKHPSEEEVADEEENKEEEEEEEEEDSENYIRFECVHVLKGHRSDISDISWSQDSQFLCSGSMDCKIMVWSLGNENPIHTLDGHDAWISSVDWDPIGAYIASVSKDNVVKIWSTNTWECVHTESSLQNDKYGCGLYKAARWSPDGSNLCLTHACYKQYPSAILLSRGKWAPQVVFVGHAGIVGICRYAARLIHHDSKNLQLVAIGCDDGSISLWRNDLQQPLLVIKGASKNVVTDIAFSPSCRELLFTAGECVVAAQLEEEELGGKCLTKEEMITCLQKEGKPKKLSMVPSASFQKPTIPAPITADRDIPATIPSTPSTVTIPSTTNVTPTVVTPTVPAVKMREAESRDSKKRAADAEEYETPVTRKRKRHQASAPEQVSTVPELSFPAFSITLPCTMTTVHSAKPRILTIQAISTTLVPLTDSSTDDVVGTLVQQNAGTGETVWSWLGQGRCVLSAMTSRFIFCLSRNGLVHVVTMDGRTALPALCIGGEPSCMCCIDGKEGDRICVLSTSGRFWVASIDLDEKLKVVYDGRIDWLKREGITDMTLNFTSFDTIRLFMRTKETEVELQFSIESNCWFDLNQPIFSYAYHSNKAAPPSLSSPLSTSRVLTALVSFTYLESQLYNVRYLVQDKSEYFRLLTSYVKMINENNDLKRLTVLVKDLKGKAVMGEDGANLVNSIVLPAVKQNPHFAEYLSSIV